MHHFFAQFLGVKLMLPNPAHSVTAHLQCQCFVLASIKPRLQAA